LATISDSARLDIELFLCEVLSKDRSYLFTWPEHELNDVQFARFSDMLSRRLKGEPVAHILGHREFWSLDLLVSPTTLIPRADTELLVETALEKTQPNDCVLDLGTGTGAIALALAKERPDCKIDACDIDQASIDLAQRNAERHAIANVRFYQSDWFSSIHMDKQYDVILSNPPYIEEADRHLSQGDLRFEPKRALVSGKDGLDDIRIILEQAPRYLVQGGWLLIEHGWNQAHAVRALFQQADFAHVETRSDLGGNERVSLAQWA
jgi:release factor glutamine methyltransferase